MQDNTNQETWNSRQPMKNGLSPNDMAIFMTTFSASFREASIIFGQGGPAPLCGFTSEAIAGAMKKLLDENTTKQDAHDITISVCGLAYGITAAITNSNPSELAILANNSVTSMVNLAEKDPEAFANSEVHFRVRNASDEKIEVMVALSRNQEPELMGQEAIAKKAKEIAQKLGNN